MITATHPGEPTIRAVGGDGQWGGNFIDGYLTQHAWLDPGQLAIIDGDKHYTYGEIDRQILCIAATLRAWGIKRGDAVAWQLPNWAEAMVIHHAILRLGAVSNPIIPIYREREITFILNQSKAAVIFIPECFRGFDFGKMFRELREDLPHLKRIVTVRETKAVAGCEYFDRLLAGTHEIDIDIQTERHADDIALLLYTSGTTSDPKGVLHTHNTLDYENRSIIRLFDLTAADRIFMPSPVGHITGILYGLQLAPMLGSCVVLQDIWEPAAALALIAAHGCTFTLTATPFLHGLIYHPDLTADKVASLRVFACGGADVPSELIITAEKALACTVVRVYGSSEFPTLSASNSADPQDKRANTDGRLIGRALARVVNEHGGEVPVGECGELIVYGPELFVGYLDPRLNAAAFDEKGWFRTGDLASIDQDGYVCIRGRLKDIIIRGGENISAREIEDLLFKHPAVADVAMIGMPDPVLVERNCIYVVPKSGFLPSLEDFVSFLKSKKVANQKLPEHLEIIDQLPRTASGKIQKFKLKEDVMVKRGFTV